MIFLNIEYFKLHSLPRQTTRWRQTETPDLYTNEFLFFTCEISFFTSYDEKVKSEKCFSESISIKLCQNI